MSRLPTLQPADFTDPQRTLFEHITRGKRGQRSAVDSFLNPGDVEAAREERYRAEGVLVGEEYCSRLKGLARS